MANDATLINVSRGSVSIQTSDGKPGIVILPKKGVAVSKATLERDETKRLIRAGHLRAVIVEAPKKSTKKTEKGGD